MAMVGERELDEAKQMVQKMCESTTVNQLSKLIGVSNFVLNKLNKDDAHSLRDDVYEKIFRVFSDVQSGDTKLESPKRGRRTGSNTGASRNRERGGSDLDKQLEEVEHQMRFFEKLEKKRAYLLEAKELQEKHEKEMEVLRDKYRDVL